MIPDPRLVWVLLLVGAAGSAVVSWHAERITYPGFRDVRPERWPEVHRRYATQVGFIVGPLMLLQLAATAGLFLVEVPTGWRWAAAGLTALSWGWTFLLSAPTFGSLSPTLDERRLARLIRTNWVRSVAWSAQAALAAAALV